MTSKSWGSRKVGHVEKVKEILAKHKQVLADDRFIVGHALNKHLKEMFDELDAELGEEKS